LFAIILLTHSKIVIISKRWSRFRTYNFVILIISIIFIPIYAAYNLNNVIFVGLIIVLANIVALFLICKELFIVNKVNNKKTETQKNIIKKSQTLVKKTEKETKKIVAIRGGSKFHSLDCKMVENKPKKRLIYYRTAQEAQKDNLKPCKLCKAVNYMHQLENY